MKNWENLEADVDKILTVHFTKGRQGNSINKVVVHYNAGDLTVEGCYSVWQTRAASAHYQVESGGRIGQLVWDSNVGWHASDWQANLTSIGIEHANKPDGTITDECLDNGAHLVAAICKKYKLGRPEWLKNVFPHKYFAATSCLPVDTTELLTPEGWKKLKDIELDDIVATVRMDDKALIWGPVRDIVEPYVADTWLSRDLEATADHRILGHRQKGLDCVLPWKDVCGCTKKTATNQFYVPNAATYDGPGLPLTDFELELILAVQADGHYSRDSRRDNALENVRFHFMKDRKVERLIELLDDCGYQYTLNIKKDGTKDIIAEKSLYDFCEQYLSDKRLTWKFLDMSAYQRQVFLDVMQNWDGCRANESYSSVEDINLNVVQAIAATSGVGSKYDDNRIYLKSAERTINNGGAKRCYDRKVSCVTVDTGFILIRQHGRTTVVGNCPGQIYGSQKDAYIARAQAWYDYMTGATSTEPSGKPSESKPTTPTTPSTGSGNSSSSSTSGGKTGTGFGGTYTCTVAALNIRSTPSTSGTVVGQYKKGQTVILDDWYKSANGYIWGRYTSYSGATRYIAVGRATGKVEADDYLVKKKASSSSSSSSSGSTGFKGGTYRCNVATLNVRDKPSTSGKVVAQYHKGQTVVLDNWYKIANGYVWARYTSYSGKIRYISVGPNTGKAESTDYLIRV